MNASTFLSSLKVACLGLLLLTASCKHTGDVITPGGPGDSAFPCVGKNLRLTALTVTPATAIDGDGKPDSDLLHFVPECALDNTIKFDTNGTLSGSEGAKVCPDDEDGQTTVPAKSVTWTYESQKKVLRLVYGNDVEELAVVSVSATALKISPKVSSESADPHQLVMTWEAR